VSKDALYAVAYEEAVRGLAEQQRVVESFRTRAGLLFSAAAVTASFLSTSALRGGSTNSASWLALFCFVGVATASLAILWPRRWESAANPRDVIDTYIESAEPAPLANLHRDLSLHMYSSYLANREGVQQFAALLQVSSGLLTLEVVLWIAAIATTV
jgi:hypothetical protein